MLRALSLFYALIFVASTVLAQAVDHSKAKHELQYLLAIDRLDFYIQNLATHLEQKQSPELISALNAISPESLISLKLPMETLDDKTQWNEIVKAALRAQSPDLKVNEQNIEWGYNFFKNKLLERFKSLDVNVQDEVAIVSDQIRPTYRSVPKIKGEKILLDYERYVAEKTSRAIIWDSILNKRQFTYVVGTEQDFKEYVVKNRIELISEVQPMARNYNKIYLSFDPQSQSYGYIISRVSGDDRIRHLNAQLRLIKFQNQSYFKNFSSVNVIGRPTEFHAAQEKVLLNLFQRLPKADKVIIGQKGAVDEAIRSAGSLNYLSLHAPKVIADLKLEKTKKSKFESLVKNSEALGSFLLEGMTQLPVKLESAHAIVQDPIKEREYQQFNSDQASHDFADYLLEDGNGKVQRWRVFSAVWGDEIIPIARALKRSGHKNIVYIGTAGALAGKGLKVGDVVAGGRVLTHKGQVLKFSEGIHLPDSSEGKKSVSVGQVHSPFEETDRWLQQEQSRIDIVEVETGYLREHLGLEVDLQSYFLISDIVGSESETLAHAATSSSKRKRGQLKLLENIFTQNGIRAPISNLEMIPNSRELDMVMDRLKILRPSRDLYSLLQVAHIALKSGKKNDLELGALLKAQPAFKRSDMDQALLTLGTFLSELQRDIGYDKPLGVASDTLFGGTYNPKKVIEVSLYIEGRDLSSEIRNLNKTLWMKNIASVSPWFSIKLVSDNSKKLNGQKAVFRQQEDLQRLFESVVMKPLGYVIEMDQEGRFKIEEMPGLNRVFRCEAIFL